MKKYLPYQCEDMIPKCPTNIRANLNVTQAFKHISTFPQTFKQFQLSHKHSNKCNRPTNPQLS